MSAPEAIDNLPQAPDGALTTTSTQHGTFSMCPRRWWLQYVHRVKETRVKAFTVGSIFHAAMERYQLAGEDGIVPTPEKVAQWSDGDAFDSAGPLWNQIPGKPVQMFPPWFNKLQDRDGSWSELGDPKDTLNVVSMVNGVIDRGLVPHFPEEGRVVERMVMEPLADGSYYRSFVDRGSVTEAKVEDFKTVAAPKWALKPKELQTNPQLLTYGYWMLRERERQGMSIPDIVELTHIVAPKNGDAPFRRTVKVTPQELETSWDGTIENSKKMLDLHHAGPHDDWQSVEGPKPGSNACSKYGRAGCPFQGLCEGKKTLEEIKNPPAPSDTPTLTFGSMTPNPVPPRRKPALRTSEPVPAPIPAKDDLPFLPWAQADCPSCGGTGVDAKLEPCGECVGRAPSQQQPVSGSAQIDAGRATFTTIMPPEMVAAFYPPATTDPGTLQVTVIGNITTKDSWEYTWVSDDFSIPEDPQPLDVTPWGLSAPVLPSAPQTTEEPQPEPEAVEEAPVAPEPAPEPEPEPEPAPTPDPEPVTMTENPSPTTSDTLSDAVSARQGKSGGGRPKKGMTVVVGAVSIDGLGKVTRGETIVGAAMDLVAKEAGVATYYHCDPFRRRDALAAKAEQIAAEVGTGVLHLASASVETRQLIDELSSRATARILCS